MPPIIEVQDVHMSFGDVRVLQEVGFKVEAGRTMCILGGSGGGKSTLMKIMMGALRPASGRVMLDGEDICGMDERDLDRIRRKFGVMFQSGALLNSLTVAENVALPLRHHSRHDPETIDTIVKIKLHQVDLLHAHDLLPSELSGGMLKRAAVARALAMDPKILFYDEPSAGLDPVTTTRMDQLITQLRDTMGMTNVVVTHVMESVARIADHVIMLDRGRLVLDGTLEDLMRSTDPRVRQFRTGELGDRAAQATSTKDYIRDLLM